VLFHNGPHNDWSIATLIRVPHQSWRWRTFSKRSSFTPYHICILGNIHKNALEPFEFHTIVAVGRWSWSTPYIMFTYMAHGTVTNKTRKEWPQKSRPIYLSHVSPLSSLSNEISNSIHSCTCNRLRLDRRFI
jgi:hypothetical protein